MYINYLTKVFFIMTFEDIDKLCKLARIDLTKEERQKFSKEINEVILMFDELDEVNTGKIEPSFDIFDIKDKYRDDSSGRSSSISRSGQGNRVK